MFDRYRVVAVTPSLNRRRNLEVLLPYVLRDRGLIDEWHIWISGPRQKDSGFAQSLSQKHRFISVQERPDYNVQPFYSECVDPDTIYVKFDDDICWVRYDALATLLRFRMEHPEYFLVLANTVNNGICSFLHQARGAIPQDFGALTYNPANPIAYRNEVFVLRLHNFFLNVLADGTEDRFFFDTCPLSNHEGFSVNYFAMFGRDFAATGGQIPLSVSDEGWLNTTGPSALKKINAICGSSLVAHYAFFTQRPVLDATPDILERYAKLAEGMSLGDNKS